MTGVELDSGEAVDADLVVDAAGRGTRLPVWLAQWGFERPREDSIDVGIGYASHQLRIPDGLIAEKVVVAGASCEQPLGLGMLYYEDGTWGVTTFGVGKVEPPHDFAAMCALADEIVPAHVAAAHTSGRADRRRGVPQVSDQPVAPLRQARPLPGRDHSRSATPSSASTRPSGRA